MLLCYPFLHLIYSVQHALFLLLYQIIFQQILVEELKVQARVNTKGQPWTVDVRSESHANVEKAVNLLDAFFKGFDLGDAEAIVRVDGLYIETFRVQDVKSSLKGDHMARAVGRLAGYNGRTKFAIENSTKTRIVIADQTVHILGSYNNLALARRALCDLILGAQPNKVFGRMRSLSARANAAF